MKLGRLDASYFRRKFGSEILELFAGTFGELRDEGYLDWKDDEITLTREGLLRVDGLLPRFFLPEHRGARYT
jgi:oxygen-independent coproporphyrinogen-3 oxidase